MPVQDRMGVWLLASPRGHRRFRITEVIGVRVSIVVDAYEMDGVCVARGKEIYMDGTWEKFFTELEAIC